MKPIPIFDITSLGSLYESVQEKAIFSDSKTFVDALPLAHSETILLAYQEEKDKPAFDLVRFVNQYFILPQAPASEYLSNQKPIALHIDALWKVLTRTTKDSHGTLIPLPHPFVVPGGRFREIYYWDTFFTMLGLKAAGRDTELIQMVQNFAYLIDLFGFIPNGNRSYYLGRSQPPFFACMLGLLPTESRISFRSQLEKEYQFWMSTQRCCIMPDGSELNRYWDQFDTPRPEAYKEDVEIAQRSNRPHPEVYRHIRAAAESGWDFSSRWFADPQDMATIQTTDLIPVDLNCLLVLIEKQLLAFMEHDDDQDAQLELSKRHQQRINAIHRYCWSETENCFFDYNWKQASHSKCFTLAMAFPLYAKIATADQAKHIAVLLENKFLFPGGLTTTLNRTGQQWDAPNGWAPLQWIAYQGLLNYNMVNLAETLRQRWLNLNEKTYQETGKMMEKYNVMDPDTAAGGGEYPNQDGFGWTNGVYLALTQK